MFSLKNRVLVVASSLETNGTEAFSQHGSLNADRMLLDTFMDKPDQTQVQYKMVFFFASVSDTNGFIDLKLLKKFYGAVASGGTISFHLALPKEDTDAVVQRFNKYATYSGFVNPQITRDEQSPESRRLIQLIAQKPSWSSGDGACLSLKPAAQEELIDESSLIDSTEVYVPMGKGKSDCASKPRACANCTCGRKELEVQLGAEEAKERLESAAVRSSCGNCYLGDAFRCSGCPYKGLPAFKPGEKVQLDLS